MKSDTTREGCREACFGSMKRQGVDYLDLFILRGHGGHGETPIEDSVRYMKVRHLTELLPGHEVPMSGTQMASTFSSCA